MAESSKYENPITSIREIHNGPILKKFQFNKEFYPLELVLI